MSGGATSFLEALDQYTRARRRSSADKPVLLGTVDPAYSGTGLPKVTFEGESTMSTKGYPYLYQPQPEARVALLPVGTTYLIVGTIGLAAPGGGATGATGALGATGATGAGVTGATGPVGATGVQGATGPQGIQGVQGATGATGPQGTQGATGAQGIQGVQGATGATGTSFVWEGAWVTATAYQVNDVVRSGGSSYIATAGHTSGASTEPGVGASWATVWALMAQMGATGAGATGATGPTGSAGALGATGATGPAGTAGSAGAAGATGATGPAGSAGGQGATGATGAGGAAGGQGATGATGPTGYPGPEAELYTYSATTTDADPGAGVIRLNNATLSSVTQAYIDLDNAGGTTVTGWLDSLDDSTNTVKGVLTLRRQNAPAIHWATYTLTAVTSATGYRKLSLTYVASSGSLDTTTANTVVSFSRAGNVGSAGTQGATGATGATGAQGATGATGPTRNVKVYSAFLGSIMDITSTSYQNFTDASVSITKSAGTSLAVTIQGTAFADSGSDYITSYGVTVNSSNYDVCRLYWNNALVHMAFGGTAAVTGVGAGTFTVQVVAKNSAGSQMTRHDTSDHISLMVMEF